MHYGVMYDNQAGLRLGGEHGREEELIEQFLDLWKSTNEMAHLGEDVPVRL